MSGEPEIEDHFQLTLPSNVRGPYEATNRPWSYRTVLSRKIELEGKWKVALTGLLFPHHWVNVPTMEVGILLAGDYLLLVGEEPPISAPTNIMELMKHFRRIWGATEIELVATTHHGTNYRSVTEMIEVVSEHWNQVIRDRFPNLGYSLHFEYDRSKHQLSIETAEDKYVYIFFNHYPNVMTMLGDTELTVGTVGDYQYYVYFLPTKGLRPLPVSKQASINVHSNITVPRMLGDGESRILRIVPVTVGQSEVAYWTTFVPQYMSVSTPSLEMIEIEIRDWKNKLIWFERTDDRVVAMLDFKRKHSI